MATVQTKSKGIIHMSNYVNCTLGEMWRALCSSPCDEVLACSHENTHTHAHTKDSRTPGLTLPKLTHCVVRGQNEAYVNRLNTMATKFQPCKYQRWGGKKTHLEISISRGIKGGPRQRGAQESK